MWDALRLDVWHSFRRLRRAPTFSLIVVGTLTLAVGATTAVGSLLNALVWRTLTVRHPEQLVALSALEPRANVSGYFYADTFKAYRSAQRSFAQMSMYSGGGLLRVETRSAVFEEASTEAVSPEYFDIDPRTLLIAAAISLATALAASLFPALRASRIAPVEALREE